MIKIDKHWQRLSPEEKMNESLSKAKTPYDKLLVAAAYGNIPLAKDLIKSGVEINPSASEFVTTPLYAAVASNQVKMVNFLISQGANVNLSSRRNLYATPLEGSIVHRHLEMFNVLIDRGADVNLINPFTQETPLFDAIFLAQYKFDLALTMIKRLLELNANLNVINEFGKTPLECAKYAMGAWKILGGESVALHNFSILEKLFAEQSHFRSNLI